MRTQVKESVKDRLIQFIKAQNITNKNVETRCSMSNAAIRNSKGGFGSEVIERILEQYPQLNRNWLLFGEGEMLNNSQNNNSGNIVNGRDNFFAQQKEKDCAAILSEKDKRIEELTRQVEFLQNLTNNLMSKTK